MPETKERQIAFKFILKLRVRYMGKCHITVFIPLVALEARSVEICIV